MVGLGRWGRSLMEAAKGSERIRFARTADPIEGTRLEDVLRDRSVQAVVLATPHSLHGEQAIAAAQAGKHVFCEKPLALRLADAQAMVEACRGAGVVLAVGHNRRFWPAMRALKRIVDSGDLGELLHVEGHNSNENSNRVTGGWRTSPAESPGGGFTGAGLHALDAMIMLCGAVRRVHWPIPDPGATRGDFERARDRIAARLPAIEPMLATPPRTTLAPATPDTLCALYEFANGASGTLATVRATPFYWRVHAFGSNGSAEVLGESKLLLRISGKPQQKIVFDASDSLRAELEAFADAVEERAPYPITPEQILATVGAFEATVNALTE